MSAKYQRKFVINLLIGLLFISAGTVATVYASFTHKYGDDWKFWALLITGLIVAGLLFTGNAFVSKVKADFIRKQKRQSQ